MSAMNATAKNTLPDGSRQRDRRTSRSCSSSSSVCMRQPLVAPTLFGLLKRKVIGIFFGTVLDPNFRRVCLRYSLVVPRILFDFDAAFALHGRPLRRSNPPTLRSLQLVPVTGRV